MKNARYSMSKAPAFTLLELLIVLAVVGILGALVYPSYTDSVRKANRSAAIAELQTIIAAQERYFLANKEYAVTLNLLGFEKATHTIDNYTIVAQDCPEPNNDSQLCIEIRANASNTRQEEDGDVVMNTIGRSELVVHESDKVKEQL